MATQIVRKIYSLADGQTVVDLVSSLTGFWTINVVDGNTDNGPLVNQADDGVNYDYTVINDFQIELRESYPLGTQLIVVTDGDVVFAPGGGPATAIDWLILYVPDPLVGKPLFNGQVYVGQPDFDPEIVSNQKQLYVIQEDGSQIEVPQPFQLSSGGVPTYNGSAVRLAVEGNYSIKILSKQGVQKYYFSNVLEGAPITSDNITDYACLKMDSKIAAINYNFKEGDCFNIPTIGANYIVGPVDDVALIGDLTLASGLKASLQPYPDGSFNVLWFDADPTQPDQYIYFDLAAQRAFQAMLVSAGGTNTRGPVRVPAQNWTLGQQVPTEAIWYIDPGAEFTQPTNYLPSNTDNLEYLKGEVFKIGARGFNVLQLGSPDLDWVANNWRASSQGTAVVSAASSNGTVGFSSFTKSSDNSQGGEGTIGYQSYAANDNETNIGSVYNYFAASYRLPGAGATFSEESNVTTIGDMKPVFPYGDYGGTYGQTVNKWLGGPEGGTVGGFDDTSKRPTSAAVVVSPGLAINPGNGKKWGFDAGIVFLKVAFENGSQDVIRSFTGSRFQYWRDSGGDSVVRLIGNEDEASAGSGKYEVQIRNVSDGSLVNYRFYRDKFITTDNKADLGIDTNRWITGYFYNAPDVVSDRTEKYDETNLSENEINCFIEVGKLTKKWKWIKERDSKQDGETVYWHVGQIAQDLWDKMEEYGLDPTKWGLINKSANTGKYSVCKEEINSLVLAAIIAKAGL